jgi:hypothetical protein
MLTSSNRSWRRPGAQRALPIVRFVLDDLEGGGLVSPDFESLLAMDADPKS